MFNLRFWTLTGVVALAAALRLMPHPWNATPIAAMALFAGVHFSNRKIAFLVPLLAMFISDLVLGWHSLVGVVYGCFAVTVWLGQWVRRDLSVLRVASASLGASMLFFLVTNFAVWLTSGLYSQTGAGLSACFVAASPFFRHTLLGDLAYTALFFGAFHLSQLRFPVLRESAVSL